MYLDPGQSTAGSRSIDFNLSRAVGNLGAPLGTVDEMVYDDDRILDRDREPEGDDNNLIIYSDDPLAAGLGLKAHTHDA